MPMKRDCHFETGNQAKGICDMATIDVDKLRDYMKDYCGMAMMSGFQAAVLDVADVERASGEELCRMAEQMGVDLRQFVIGG